MINALGYKRWADDRCIAAIRQMDAARFPDKAAFVRQQLNHMIRVEELFRAHLSAAAAPHESTNTASLPTLDELDVRLTHSNDWYASFVENLGHDGRDHRIQFRFVDGQIGNMSILEILFHVLNHGTYHRGAIGHALDLTGVAHPADTYTVFIHAAEPERRTLRRQASD